MNGARRQTCVVIWISGYRCQPEICQVETQGVFEVLGIVGDMKIVELGVFFLLEIIERVEGSIFWRMSFNFDVMSSTLSIQLFFPSPRVWNHPWNVHCSSFTPFRFLGGYETRTQLWGWWIKAEFYNFRIYNISSKFQKQHIAHVVPSFSGFKSVKKKCFSKCSTW